MRHIIFFGLAPLLIPACGSDSFTTSPADLDESGGGASANDHPEQDDSTDESSELPSTVSTGGSTSSDVDTGSGETDATGGTTSSGGSNSTGGTANNGPPTCGSGNCPNWHDDFNIDNPPEDAQCVSTVWNQAYEEWIFVGNSWDINCGPRSSGTYCWNDHDKHYGPRYEPCP